jgi:transcriptional repressor NrdR
MHCPYCDSNKTDVVETRDSEDINTIRRRRACLQCTKRFTTYERVENVHLTVIKKQGKREQFNREKLKIGLLKSCEKTNVSLQNIEQIVNETERELRSAESVEVDSAKVGEIVANKLKLLDTVAYIRFASVFKQFVDVEDFEKEIKRLGLAHSQTVDLQTI